MIEGFFIFILIVIIVVLALAGLAVGAAMLPILIPLFIIYLCFAYPAVGLPLLFLGAVFLLARKA